MPDVFGSQIVVPQHWNDDVQVESPSGRHDGVVSHVPLALQVSPEQHGFEPEHDCPVVWHADIAWHVPDVHDEPEQQSELFWQL